MNIEFDIPKGYIIDASKSNEHKLVFKPQEILVPESIKITSDGIFFANGHQVLTSNNGYYNVYTYDARIFNFVRHKLVPIKREDLRPGDIAYRTDMNNPILNDTTKYCIILNDNTYTYLTANDEVIQVDCSFNYWYKVIHC
jgi:hypothetical protein